MSDAGHDGRGCLRCWPDDPAQASRVRLVVSHTLVDESHFIMTLKACECGQRFLAVFAERIDWVNGEDPQERLLVPIDADAFARFVAGDHSLTGLGDDRDHLWTDWLSGGEQRAQWLRAPLLIPPHD